MDPVDVTPRHQHVMANGVRFHVVTAGPTTGQPVVLLHGFPESWRAWRNQVPALAAAGFRVIAPDLRGYGGTDKPPGIRAYDRSVLAADVVALAQALGHRRFHVVGHDFGGIVAWHLAQHHAEHVHRMVAINAPQADVVRWSYFWNPVQLARAFYVFFLLIPFADRALAWRGFALLRWFLFRYAGTGAFPEDERAHVLDAWSQPGALRAMAAWYRAETLRLPARTRSASITVPTLVLWGRRDRSAGAFLARASARLCRNAELVFIDDAGHFAQHQQPDAVNQALVRFLSSP